MFAALLPHSNRPTTRAKWLRTDVPPGEAPPQIHPTALVGKEPLAPKGLLQRVVCPPSNMVDIGHNTVVGPQAIIYAGARIGHDCLIGDGAIIRENAVIGNNCVIGLRANIGHDAHIGDNCRIMDCTTICGCMVVGHDTFIGPHVSTANEQELNSGKYSAPVIGSHVAIGASVVILPGVRIGDNSRIAAGLIIRRSVAAGMYVTPRSEDVTRHVELRISTEGAV